MKCLTHIILTSTKPKERNEAMAIKKQIENFDFVCMLVVQCKILEIVNIPSKAMQCKTINLISAHILLQTAAEDIVQLKRSFGAVLSEGSTIASTWSLPRQFFNKSAKKTKAYFVEIYEGITFSDLKKRFCVTAFFPIMDILSCQLINRFEGMKLEVTSYQVLEPNFLNIAGIFCLSSVMILQLDQVVLSTNLLFKLKTQTEFINPIFLFILLFPCFLHWNSYLPACQIPQANVCFLSWKHPIHCQEFL